MAKKLIGLGADVHTGNHNGRSALSFAAEKEQDKLVELLLNNGCNPNVGDKDGWTPAHYAANHGNVHTLKLLWEHGADLDQRTNWEFGFLPGPSAKQLYGKYTMGWELPTKKWREEKIKGDKAAKQEPQITANTQSNGNAINALTGNGQNISNEVAEVVQSDNSRSV